MTRVWGRAGSEVGDDVLPSISLRFREKTGMCGVPVISVCVPGCVHFKVRKCGKMIDRGETGSKGLDSEEERCFDLVRGLKRIPTESG